MANDTSRLQGASSPISLNSLRDAAFRSERADDTGSGVDGLFRQTFDSQREQWASRQQALQSPSRDASADNRKSVAARRQDTAARDASQSHAQAAAGKKTPRTETTARKPVAKNAGRQESGDNEVSSNNQSANSAAKSADSRPASARMETSRGAGGPGNDRDLTSASRDDDRVAADSAAGTSCAPIASNSGNPAESAAEGGATLNGSGDNGDPARATPEAGTVSPDGLLAGASALASNAAAVSLSNEAASVDASNVDGMMMSPDSGSQSGARLQEVSDLMRSMQPVNDENEASSIDGLQHILARLEQVKSTLLPDESVPGMSDGPADARAIQDRAAMSSEGDEGASTTENLTPEQLTVTLSELADESPARALEKQSALAADALTGNQTPGGSAAQHAFFRANSLMASSMQLQWAQSSGNGGEKPVSLSADLTSAGTPGTATLVDTEFAMQTQTGGQQGGSEGESSDGAMQEQLRLAQWQSRGSESLGKIGSEVESAFGRIGSNLESRGSDTGSSPIITDVRSLMMQRDAEVRQLQAATPVAQGDPLVPGRAGFAQAMGERIMMLMTQKVSAADIVLDPRELGPVEVKIRQDKDQTTLMFASHHPAVREQLEASLPKLRDLFSQAGLSLGNVSVGDRQAGGNGGNQGGQERWQGTEAQDVLDGVQPTASSRKPRDERAVDFYA